MTFLRSGNVQISEAALREALSDFVQSMLDRLDLQAPDDWRTRRLHQYWTLAVDEAHEDHAASRLAARLGKAWWPLTEEEKSLLRSKAGTIANLVTDALEELATLSDLSRIERIGGEFWNACTAASPASEQWKSLRAGLATGTQPATHEKPWDLGWWSAQQLRRYLDVPEYTPVSTSDFLLEAYEQATVADLPESVRALVAWKAGNKPVRGNPDGSTGEFSRLRDSYPMLFNGSDTEDGVWVLSDRVVGHLPIANAFATELLSPVERIRKALRASRTVTSDEIARIASDIGAPFMCVLHQIENHRLATVEP